MISGTSNNFFKHVIYNVETGEVEEVYRTSDRHEETHDERETIIIDIEPVEDEEEKPAVVCVNDLPALYNRKGEIIKSKIKSKTIKSI